MTLRDGTLYADLPTSQAESIEFTTDTTDERPEITLVFHAALLIEYDGFTLLTDPWIDGPAFLGAWTQYPPSPFAVADLTDEVDAIWITHTPTTRRRFLSSTPRRRCTCPN